jgi:hypothetical protein
MSVVSIAPNHDSQAARRSHPTGLATHAVIFDHDEDNVARAVRAIRAAYDDLQAVRAIRHSKIPSSLSDADKVLDKLCGKLTALAESSEALSIFREYTLKEAYSSVETSLSDAIVHDMEATATYFRTMNLVGPAGVLGSVEEQKCQNIKVTVDRYETIVSTVLSKHRECVRIESMHLSC